MIEFLELSPDINVLESEYKRLLGYPAGHHVEDKVIDLMNSTRDWYRKHGMPWFYVRQAESFNLSEEHFAINNQKFCSKRVADQMRIAKGHSAVIAVVSAGKNCEDRARQLWHEEKPDEYFFMEVFGSAMVEHLVTAVSGRICDWAERNGMRALPRYSPGYPEWDIREQQALFNIAVPQNQFSFPEQIHVMKSGMLNPKKSLLTVFGLTKQTEAIQNNESLIPCNHCSLANCQYRRAPYKQTTTQIEDVGRLGSPVKNGGRTPLQTNAKYSFSQKALEKWSKERLVYKILDDSSVVASFHYEGSTCSNMGRPLEFEYHLKLDSLDQEYIIREALCKPSSGDTGHTFMCQFVENPDSMMSAIQNEKPLLGKPLNAVLTWEREYNPSACYCRLISREYKWGLVLEVLHYALVKYEKENVLTT